MKNIYIFGIIFLLANGLAYAQKINIYSIYTTKFPIVAADFFVSDQSGKLIKGLNTNSFSILENGKQRKILTLDCPVEKEPEAISSVLTFDISGSMASGAPNINLAKAAGKIWVNSMPLGKSECAVTSFNHLSFVNQDFTTDRDLLLQTIDKFSPRGGTDYNEAFLNDLTGNIKLASKGRAKRVIVFLTDGMPNNPPNETEIINRARKNNIIIYSIAVGMRIPDVLKNISTSTGGMWFEKVARPEQIEAIYLNILEKSQGGRPCQIQWESEIDCDSLKNIEIRLKDFNISESSSYNTGANYLSLLEVTPRWHNFGKIIPPQKEFKDFEIKALSYKVQISNISIPDVDFKIETQINYPILLNKGQSIKIRVSFQPKDTTLKYVKLKISTDACNDNDIVLLGGERNKDEKIELKLIQPNGGERIKASSSTKIIWTGIHPDSPVDLYFSLNIGSDWTSISKNITGNEYVWQVPDTMSDECLMRISTASESDEFIILKGHKAKITSIEWGNDFNTILSGGSDNKSNIWNIANKRILSELIGHNGKINSISINNNNFAATSSDDGTIKIWDLNTSALSKTLYGHANKVTSARWLSSTNLLFSTSYDTDVRIWNVLLGQSGKPMENHIEPILTGDHSPDASLIVTGGIDGKLNFWDVKSNSFLSEISVTNDTIYALDWNRKGDLIACGYENGIIDIYVPGSKIKLKSFKAHSKSVKSLEFSPDSKHLATASDDHTIRIWETINYELIKEFRGHKAGVNCVKWSKDGLKIASGAEDSTVIIWDFLVNSDVSDSLWSICKPNIISFDLDLGPEFVGFFKDSVISNFIENKGNDEEIVNNISITGLNANEFEIVSPIPTFYVPRKGSSAVEIRFKPNSAGLKIAEIHIESGSKSLKQRLKAEAILPVIELLTKNINFGEVPLGDSKQKTEAILKNVSSKPVEILSSSIIGPDEEQFRIIDGGGRFFLQPGETKQIVLEFRPVRMGKTSSEIQFTIANTGTSLTALLFGEGLGKEVKISLEIKNSSAKSGETVKIPLYLFGSAELYKIGIKSINTTIAFNSTLLLPIESTPRGKIINGERKIDVNIPIINQDTIITDLHFLAAWGNAEETELVPENTYSSGLNLFVTEKSGKFRLLDLCHSGGTRFFIDTSLYFLTEIYPNPANKTVTFSYSIIEQEPFELILINSIGKIENIIETGRKASGVYKTTLYIENYQNGLYYLIFKNGSKIEFRKFLIFNN